MTSNNLFELRFRVQSPDLSLLQNFTFYLRSRSKKNNFSFQSINLPNKLQKFTVLRSPHVNKKAKDQYEIKFFNRLYIIGSSVFIYEFLRFLKFHPSLSIKLQSKKN